MIDNDITPISAVPTKNGREMSILEFFLGGKKIKNKNILAKSNGRSRLSTLFYEILETPFSQIIDC